MVTLSFAETTFFRLYDLSLRIKRTMSLGGFEPSTFRLTVERANRLRHRDSSLATCTYMSIWNLINLLKSKRLPHAEKITDYWSCFVNKFIFTHYRKNMKFSIRLQSHEDKISIIHSRIFSFLNTRWTYTSTGITHISQLRTLGITHARRSSKQPEHERFAYYYSINQSECCVYFTSRENSDPPFWKAYGKTWTGLD